MKKLGLLLCLLSVVFAVTGFAFAQEYYADTSINVGAEGTSSIKGITNNPSLSIGNHQEFTSKKGPYWLLNITPGGEFSDYVMEITLPVGAEINYLKTSGRSRISYSDGIRIIVSGSGELEILVQYQIKEDAKQNSVTWIVLVVVLILAAIAVTYALKWKERRSEPSARIKAKTASRKNAKHLSKQLSSTKKAEPPKDEFSNARIIKKTLSESQEKILDILLDAGGELAQKQLQHRSGIAKATLSRNIDILSRKGIITKQSRGLSNRIALVSDSQKADVKNQ